MKNIAFFLLLIPFTLTAQKQVSGRVTDAENSEPVVGVSVFISNTSIGTFTDLDGFYRLTVPEDGSFQLTFSHAGYKLVSKSIMPGNTPISFNVALQIHELQGVTVTANVRFRQTDINLFWKTILGESPSKKKIWVVNPETVFYFYNSETRILRVTCREPLQIVNYETGYQIHYVLDYFTHDYKTGITDWSNQTAFTELKPENINQQIKWEKKRREVYNISLAKFIKSLYNNSLYEDGFVLAGFNKFSSANNPYQITLLNPDSILSSKSADNSKTLNLSQKQLILLCYGRPVTTDDLHNIQYASKKVLTSGLLANLLQGDSIHIFPNGTFANKLQMAPVNGSDVLLSLNRKLPFEYRSEEIRFIEGLTSDGRIIRQVEKMQIEK